jgi:hypothetical protein
MITIKTLLILSLSILLVTACGYETDDEKPTIDMSAFDAFPVNCDTLFRNESFIFKAIFTDNVELGSFSIDIHHNFDHHSHSTSISNCILSPVKTPVNPFLFIKEYSIPPGSKSYEASIEIMVPEDADTGDYHFFLSLTDHTGWRAEQGISVKITDR